MSAYFAQPFFVGGLFTQYRQDSDDKYVVHQDAVRTIPAVQLAIDRINDKSDGVYDNLLPNTQVRHLYSVDSLFW